MTLDEVRACVQAIRATRDDDEMAHDMEDALYRAVLATICGGAPDAPALAREALRTQQIEFARWTG